MSTIVCPSPEDWEVLQRLGIASGEGIALIVPPDVQEWMKREIARHPLKPSTRPSVVSLNRDDLADHGRIDYSYETDDAQLWVDVAGAEWSSTMEALRAAFKLPAPTGERRIEQAAELLAGGLIIDDDGKRANLFYEGWRITGITPAELPSEYTLTLEGAEPITLVAGVTVDLFPAA